MPRIIPDVEPIPDGHAFAETQDRHPGDRRLREHGFRIAARPRGRRPAVWSRRGLTMVESVAAMMCDAEDASA